MTAAAIDTHDSKLLPLVAPVVVYGCINGVTNPILYSTAPLAFWTVDCIFAFILPTVILWILATQCGVWPSSYGLRTSKLSAELLGTTILFVALLAAAHLLASRISWAVLWRTGAVDWSRPLFAYVDVLPSGLLRLPATVYLSVTAGLFESIFYIGIPWLYWRQRFGANHKALFALLSALVFALIHWEQAVPGVGAAFVFGLVACRLYLRIGDLWPVVAAHTVVDVVYFW